MLANLALSRQSLLDKGLEKEKNAYVQSIRENATILDEIFPQGNNPTLDTIISNQLLSILAPAKTPLQVTSRQRYKG